MLAALGEANPVVGETFSEASEVLGFDLWKLCQEGPEEDLNSTRNTQPAMLAAGVATWRCCRLRQWRLYSVMRLAVSRATLSVMKRNHR